MMRPISVLPVPDSPRSSTVALVGATFSIWRCTSCMDRLLPTMYRPRVSWDSLYLSETFSRLRSWTLASYFWLRLMNWAMSVATTVKKATSSS